MVSITFFFFCPPQLKKTKSTHLFTLKWRKCGICVCSEARMNATVNATCEQMRSELSTCDWVTKATCKRPYVNGASGLQAACLCFQTSGQHCSPPVLALGSEYGIISRTVTSHHSLHGRNVVFVQYFLLACFYRHHLEIGGCCCKQSSEDEPYWKKPEDKWLNQTRGTVLLKYVTKNNRYMWKV